MNRHAIKTFAILAVGVVSLGGASHASADSVGEGGCTAAFWSSNTDLWEEYPPDTLLGSLFAIDEDHSALRSATMLQAVSGELPDEGSKAVRRLLSAASTAYLNAASEPVGYPYRRFSQPFHIEVTVNSALASDRTDMKQVARVLEAANDSTCPMVSPDDPLVAGPPAGAAPTAGGGSSFLGGLPSTGADAGLLALVAAGTAGLGGVLASGGRRRR